MLLEIVNVGLGITAIVATVSGKVEYAVVALLFAIYSLLFAIYFKLDILSNKYLKVLPMET